LAEAISGFLASFRIRREGVVRVLPGQVSGAVVPGVTVPLVAARQRSAVIRAKGQDAILSTIDSRIAKGTPSRRRVAVESGDKGLEPLVSL